MPKAAERPHPGLLQIDLDRIRPNRNQPRTDFETEALEELARSLEQTGVLQPVVVRELEEGRYELVVGERRWRAAQIAGLLKVPAVVRELSDDKMLEVALVENLQREELNPIETALAFQQLIDDHGLTQQEVADRVGRRRATVANILRLLSLPTKVQQQVRAGHLSLGHAKAVASLGSPKQQVELGARIVKDGLSVRQAEALAANLNRAPRAATGKSPEARDPNVVAAETRLQQELGTRVKIFQDPKGRGRMELHFFSAEELQRLYDLCMRGASQ